MTIYELFRILSAGIVATHLIQNEYEKFQLKHEPLKFALGIAFSLVVAVVAFAILKIAVILRDFDETKQKQTSQPPTTSTK